MRYGQHGAHNVRVLRDVIIEGVHKGLVILCGPCKRARWTLAARLSKCPALLKCNRQQPEKSGSDYKGRRGT